MQTFRGEPVSSLVGRKINRLTLTHVIEKRDSHNELLAEFYCECGRSKTARLSNVFNGNVTSCGCKRAENAFKNGVVIHGYSRVNARTPDYLCWDAMKSRCINSRSANYVNYGARGISVCDRWLGSFGFLNFISDMGSRPSPRHSLDRINNDGNYEPSNCRWATTRQQARNKRTARIVEFNGESLPIVEWSERTGLKYDIIHNRISSGWSPSDALTTPVNGRRNSRKGSP